MADKAVELSNCLGGLPTSYGEIQGIESTQFRSYFESSGGIQYIEKNENDDFPLPLKNDNKIPQTSNKFSLKISNENSNSFGSLSGGSTPKSPNGSRVPGLHLKPIDPITNKIVGDSNSFRSTGSMSPKGSISTKSPPLTATSQTISDRSTPEEMLSSLSINPLSCTATADEGSDANYGRLSEMGATKYKRPSVTERGTIFSYITKKFTR